ncbi:hypothetical protein J6590_073822 [Homalodisca vitripennis]|nr:hypothetical protein J6590_073822 [Homalodisca vitripennis]
MLHSRWIDGRVVFIQAVPTSGGNAGFWRPGWRRLGRSRTNTLVLDILYTQSEFSGLGQACNVKPYTNRMEKTSPLTATLAYMRAAACPSRGPRPHICEQV